MAASPSKIMKRMVKINGRMLNVETTGPANGPVVVFLHHGLGAIHLKN